MGLSRLFRQSKSWGQSSLSGYFMPLGQSRSFRQSKSWEQSRSLGKSRPLGNGTETPRGLDRLAPRVEGVSTGVSASVRTEAVTGDVDMGGEVEDDEPRKRNRGAETWTLKGFTPTLKPTARENKLT